MTKTPEQRRAEAIDALAEMVVKIMDRHGMGVVEEALRETNSEESKS